MATFDTQGISLYYETHGTRGKPPILLVSGLGGAGTSWGAYAERFAKDYFVVIPDQRGTGKTTRSEERLLHPTACDGPGVARHSPGRRPGARRRHIHRRRDRSDDGARSRGHCAEHHPRVVVREARRVPPA